MPGGNGLNQSLAIAIININAVRLSCYYGVVGCTVTTVHLRASSSEFAVSVAEHVLKTWTGWMPCDVHVSRASLTGFSLTTL